MLDQQGKIHLIDLEIWSGVQWTALMQALADRQRRLDRLKITVVGLRGIQMIEETGKRLETFAKSMNLPFMFKPVEVSCMSEIKEELFETAADETVVVIAHMILRTMLSRPACLQNLMGVIKIINPSLMIVGEVEANHISPTFVNRFNEALFFYGAYFDRIETCLEQSTEHGTITEAIFSEGIENMVAREGTDRGARNDLGSHPSTKLMAVHVLLKRTVIASLLGGKEHHCVPFQLGSFPERDHGDPL
ncbi:hypothetical protein OIU85_011210 [Salix viminalis]|uniref:DELLA protein n=1 Tax=Salix viminalis TaxID=40686 RepID=A0A9Q0NSA9_SALVM|nr:hypothetical protein OIU85_011210 [Salix viminalis]